LTKGETQDILFNNNTNVNKSIREILEAKNHQTAFDYLLKQLLKHKKINEDLILKLHSILMSGILPNAGSYRNHAVRIIGTNIPTANYLSITKLMNKLFLEINKKSKDIIFDISNIHAEFERIHPFSDGNGRIGRLLLIGQLLNHNLPPAIIKKEYKRHYYTYLAKAQSTNDFSLLENFICDTIILGLEILDIK
jgi:Fic family protein